MKNSFFAEIKRLDSSSSWRPEQAAGILEFEACELQPDYLENLIEIRGTIAGRLALDLNDEENNPYFDDHIWRLYYDFDGDEDWEDISAIEYNLSHCLMALEKENILSLEAKKAFEKLVVADDEYIEQFDKTQMDYRRKIVTECYKNGKFETENWRIKVRHL